MQRFIHPDDYIYHYHMELQGDADRDLARARVIEYYFLDGDRSASQLHGLVRLYHPQADTKRLSLLELAANYGCVSRHLRAMDGHYDLVACDFHPQAVAFLGDRLGIAAMLSTLDPGAFAPGRHFDVVFALYFFNHTGPRTFGAWLAALSAALADDGILVFVTHGRVPYEDLGRPGLQPAGFWFAADSDRRHLPTEEYGHMVVTPHYVMDCLARCPGVSLVGFQEALWWGKQDVYVVRKVRSAFGPVPSEISVLEQAVLREREVSRALRGDIETIRASTSWQLTAPLRQVARLILRQR